MARGNWTLQRTARLVAGAAARSQPPEVCPARSAGGCRGERAGDGDLEMVLSAAPAGRRRRLPPFHHAQPRPPRAAEAGLFYGGASGAPAAGVFGIVRHPAGGWSAFRPLFHGMMNSWTCGAAQTELAATPPHRRPGWRSKTKHPRLTQIGSVRRVAERRPRSRRWHALQAVFLRRSRLGSRGLRTGPARDPRRRSIRPLAAVASTFLRASGWSAHPLGHQPDILCPGNDEAVAFARHLAEVRELFPSLHPHRRRRSPARPLEAMPEVPVPP